MGHRLPVNLLVALLAACSGASPGDSGAVETHTTGGDSSSNSTTTGPPADEYVFELDVDGLVTKELRTTLVGLVENSGPDCETSWTLSFNGQEFEDRVVMVAGIDAAPTVGVGGALGADAPDDNRIATLWVWELVDGRLVETSYSTPGWTFTALGVDTLELQLDAGTVCPFVASSGDDTSGCATFSGATLRLVDAPRGFDPALHCNDQAGEAGGERCYDQGLLQPENPPFCP